MDEVKAWLLGVFYGAMQFNMLLDTKQIPELKILHKKDEIKDNGQNKYGACFLNTVGEAIRNSFGIDAIPNTENGGIIHYVTIGQKIKLPDKYYANYKQGQFCIKYNSKDLCNWCLTHGVYSVRNRKNMTFPTIEEKYYKYFLRGFFESNGGSLYKCSRRFYIEFKHQSRDLLEKIREIFRLKYDIEIKSKIDFLKRMKIFNDNIGKNESYNLSFILTMKLTDRKKNIEPILKLFYKQTSLFGDEFGGTRIFSIYEYNKAVKLGLI